MDFAGFSGCRFSGCLIPVVSLHGARIDPKARFMSGLVAFFVELFLVLALNFKRYTACRVAGSCR